MVQKAMGFDLPQTSSLMHLCVFDANRLVTDDISVEEGEEL